MKKCEILADRVSLVVGKGSVVFVDEKQFELARNFLKPVDMDMPKAEVKEIETAEEKPKRKKK